MPRILRRLSGQARALEGALLLAQGLGAVTGIVLARALGPSGRGQIATLALWGQLMGWVASLSLDKALVVLTKSEHGALRRGVAMATSRRLVACLTVPIVAGSLLLGRHLFRNGYLPVMLALVAAATAQFELVGGWLLTLKRRPLFIAWRIGQPAVYFIVVGGVGVLRLEGALGSSAALNLIALGVLASVVAPLGFMFLPSLRLSSGPFSKRAARRLLRYGLAAQTANILTYLNGQLDLLTLTLISTSSAVGIYAVGASTGQLVVLLGSAAIIRGLTGEAGKGRDRLGVVASILIALIVISVAPFVVPALFGSAFRQGVRIAQILAIGSVFNYLLQVESGQLLGRNRPWQATIAQGVGVIVFAGMLVPFHTLQGVAWSSVISYVISFVVAEYLVIQGDRIGQVHASLKVRRPFEV